MLFSANSMRKRPLTLSIVIVTHNEKDYIKPCVNSIYTTLKKDKQIQFEIIIADNNSCSKFIQYVKQKLKNVILIENTSNRGFAAACNQGWRKSKHEYILFLNPDTQIQQNSISILLHFLDTHTDVGAVGPLLLTTDNTPEKWQMGYEKSIWRSVLEEITGLFFPLFNGNHLFIKIASCIDLNYTDHYKPRYIDWVSGCALMTRKSILKKVGGFDERFFLYYEEIDLQRRIKKLGWQIYHLPKARIMHKGKSTGNSKYLPHSRKLYFRKWLLHG